MRFIIHNPYRKVCWLVLGSTLLYGIFTLLDTILMCRPTRYLWDKSIPGYCVDRQSIWLSNAAFDIVTGLFIIVLPLPAIYTMQIPSKQKILLFVIFLVGTM